MDRSDYSQQYDIIPKKVGVQRKAADRPRGRSTWLPDSLLSLDGPKPQLQARPWAVNMSHADESSGLQPKCKGKHMEKHYRNVRLEFMHEFRKKWFEINVPMWHNKIQLELTHNWELKPSSLDTAATIGSEWISPGGGNLQPLFRAKKPQPLELFAG